MTPFRSESDHSTWTDLELLSKLEEAFQLEEEADHQTDHDIAEHDLHQVAKKGCIFGKPPFKADFLFPSYYATETAVYFQPQTRCCTHEKTGYLRLEDIKDDELYTRVDVVQPVNPKTTHIFDDCVIQFPLSDCLVALFDKKAINHPDRPSSSYRPALFLSRGCMECDIPVCGYGGRDSLFHMFKVFCCDECYFMYALREQQRRDSAMASGPDIGIANPPEIEIAASDKGKGILYIG